MTKPERCERPNKFTDRARGYKTQLALQLERLDGQDFSDWTEAAEAIDLLFRLFSLRFVQAVKEATDES